MLAFLFALLIGVIAGLRAMTAPAAVAWGARLGMIDVSGSWLSFFAHPAAVWIFSVLALAELVTDQLPGTPSRTLPLPFGTRIISGAVCGAAFGLNAGSVWAGTVLGAVGAVIGTLGGYAARAHLASKFGRDRPAAFIEDAVAIVVAAASVFVIAHA